MARTQDQTRPDTDRRLLRRDAVSTPVYVSVRGHPPQRARATNLSALGVFVEGRNLPLREGSVVTLTFAIHLKDFIRLQRKKAVVAHVTDEGAGLMMQGRLRRTG